MATLFTLGHRYGFQEDQDSIDLVKESIELLIQELEREEFEEPDNEHCEISVSHHSSWGISVLVSGLVIWGHADRVIKKKLGEPLDSEEGSESLYLRDIPREKVIDLLEKVARGEIDEVKKAGWVKKEELPPYKGDFFRKQT